MRKLEIALPDKRKIEINGHEFEILVGDAGILERAIEMKEFSKIKPGNDKRIIKAIQDSIGFIDEMLGKGATRKISGGRAVSLTWAIKTMEAIALEIVKEYGAQVTEEYE